MCWVFFFSPSPFLFPFPFLFFFFPFSVLSGQPHSKGRSLAPATGGWGSGMGRGILQSLFFPVAVGSQGRIKPCQVEGVEPAAPTSLQQWWGDTGVALKSPAAFGSPGHCGEVQGQGKTAGGGVGGNGTNCQDKPTRPSPLLRGTCRACAGLFVLRRSQFLICKVLN